MTGQVYRAQRGFDGRLVRPHGLSVFVRDGRIIGVEDGLAQVPDGWDLVEPPGTTLLPGLIDTHVHLCGDDGPRALDQLSELDDAALDLIVERALGIQLNAGVTAVRDLGDARWTVADRHRGRDQGPTVVASGPPITTVGGHCWAMGGQAQGREELLQAVRERVEHGVDVVKVMASGGMMTAGTDITACQYGLDELRLIVQTAHAAGLPVTAHAHATAAVEQSLDAGVDGIEHGSCITANGAYTSPELARRLADSGVALCPTLGMNREVEPPPRVRELMERAHLTWPDRLAQIGELYRAGVRLISGADAGIGPGKPHGLLPSAVVDLVDAGIGPAEALASATADAAQACGLAGRTGRLAPGLDADLLFVDGDALIDITAVLRVRTVVSRGRRMPAPTAPG